MRKLTIDFTSAKLLPDGSDLGYIGEHNATEITIIPPEEMAACESIATYVVAFATSNGVLYSDSFLKTDEISVSLTSKLTTDYYLGVQLEGYDNEGILVVKSPLVTQLQLSPSARGMGSETDGGSISGSAPSADSHSHENKNVLDLLSADGEKLMYNSKSIGGGVTSGSKFYANDWGSGAIAIDSFTTPSLLFLINEEYPENRLITDVSIRWNNGEITDYSFFELIIKSFIAGASTLTVSKKPVYEETNAMYAVAQIANVGEIINSPLYAAVQTSDASIEGFTVHYLEV